MESVCLADTFQSAPLTRGETTYEVAHGALDGNFNPLPSHEGRRDSPVLPGLIYHFNPLPSHEGRRALPSALPQCTNFNPLPSHEGRPVLRLCAAHRHSISIRSPHTRGDPDQPPGNADQADFNPLPSHEGRQPAALPTRRLCLFQSAPLTRGETVWAWGACEVSKFQSAPLTRGETIDAVPVLTDLTFQSAPLTRGETQA